MIHRLAVTYLALQVICSVLLLEVLATGKSFGGLFLFIFAGTYVVNKKLFERKV